MKTKTFLCSSISALGAGVQTIKASTLEIALKKARSQNTHVTSIDEVVALEDGDEKLVEVWNESEGEVSI